MSLAVLAGDIEIDKMITDSCDPNSRLIDHVMTGLAVVVFDGCFDNVFEKYIEHDVLLDE